MQFKTEFKTDLAAFKLDIKKEPKEEIENLTGSINLELTDIKGELARLKETEQRVAKMENNIGLIYLST